MQTVLLKQFSVVWNARREAANSTKRFNQCLKKIEYVLVWIRTTKLLVNYLNFYPDLQVMNGG